MDLELGAVLVVEIRRQVDHRGVVTADGDGTLELPEHGRQPAGAFQGRRLVFPGHEPARDRRDHGGKYCLPGNEFRGRTCRIQGG